MNKITRNPSTSEPVPEAGHVADGSVKRQTVLVLQGGGALGAYQAGVYQALVEGGIEPAREAMLSGELVVRRSTAWRDD